MKRKILLLITVFICSFTKGQTVFIPNGDFNTDVSGWNISGTNTNISNPGGFLSIDVSGSYTQNFTLTSPQFYLDGNKTYKLHSDYRNVQLDPMTMMETPLGGFTDIFLKDLNGNTVATVGLTTCQTGGYYDVCYSNNFNTTTSGIYYLEYTGQQNPSDVEFYLDNVGFEEIIQNTFSGTVTLDANNDGCATGTTVEHFPIQLNETSTNANYYVFTDANGIFLVETQNMTGNFITQTNQSLYNSTPVNYTNTISSGVNTITNQDFCITANTQVNDVEVEILPTSSPRPGFDTSVRIRYRNLGSTILSGVIVLNFNDNQENFLTASTTPDIQTNNSLSWNYTNFLPFETKYIDVDFNVNTPTDPNNPVFGGDIISYTTTITPTSGDVNSNNNTDTVNLIVVNSYDPNDMICLEGDKISPTQTPNDLTYRIRFQNTGTASAVNISVKTALDANLEWSTFQPISSSHQYTISVINDELTFRFNAINLADSTSDEPNSHGWIFYKIKPKSNSVLGDTFNATAQIFFDYNPAIITNTYTTTVSATTNIPDTNFEQALIDLDYDSGAIDGVVFTSNINTITSLDISNKNIEGLIGIEDFTALTTLNTSTNQLTTLDVNTNTALVSLDCKNNTLTSLNVKNGNNSNFTSFDATNNPNLTCIEVDDATYSTTNWTNIDTTSTFVNNQTECTALGLEKNTIPKFLLYPNPAKNILHLHSESDANYTITTVLGNIVEKGKIIMGNNTINVHYLSRGIYLIKIFSKEKSKTKKLILK